MIRFNDDCFACIPAVSIQNRGNMTQLFSRPIMLRVLCLVAGALFFTLLVLSIPVQAATLPNGFSETRVADGLGDPTAFAFAPDGRIFVTAQSGAVRVIKNGALLSTPFLTITTDNSGERGLLGIAFDPAFATNQYVYIYYTVPGSPPHNRVSRFTASGDVAVANSEVALVDLENLSATNHNGGAIHFGPDGKLYVAVGENANAANAQTLNNRLGKILRVNADGTIPTDNPFYNQATGSRRSIWALGLRNPYTFAFQPGTGRMFINDVGAGSWEEINDGIAGSNYGWNSCEGPCSPPNASYRDPLYAYPHSGGSINGCAIVGGAFYNPSTTQFPAEYVGDYFFADLCNDWISRYDPNTDTATGFATGLSTPVDLGVSSDGALYYLMRGNGGELWRVAYSSPPPTDTPTATVTATPIPHGLKGKYFDNPNLTVVKLKRVDATVDFDFGTNPPDPSMGPDTYSIRWRGAVVPRFSETYRFIVKADAGVRLSVDNVTIIDQWSSVVTRKHRGKITLNANQKYKILLEYKHEQGPAVIQLMWASASEPRAIIPTEALFARY